MPVSQEPQAHGRRDTAHDKNFIPDNDGRQHDESQSADRDRRARGDAADDELQRRIKHRCQPEQEHGDADPHDALETRQLRAQFARRVLLSRAKLGLGSRLILLYHGHRAAFTGLRMVSHGGHFAPARTHSASRLIESFSRDAMIQFGG